MQHTLYFAEYFAICTLQGYHKNAKHTLTRRKSSSARVASHMTRGFQARAFFRAAGLCAIGGAFLGFTRLSSLNRVENSVTTALTYTSCIFLALLVFFLLMACAVHCCVYSRQQADTQLLQQRDEQWVFADFVIAGKPADEFCPAQPRPIHAWPPAVLASLREVTRSCILVICVSRCV